MRAGWCPEPDHPPGHDPQPGTGRTRGGSASPREGRRGSRPDALPSMSHPELAWSEEVSRTWVGGGAGGRTRDTRDAAVPSALSLECPLAHMGAWDRKVPPRPPAVVSGTKALALAHQLA